MLLFGDMCPKISIVIATYNSQQTLEKSLKSIAQQTYPQNQIEILIVDGGSTDETLKIAQKFQTKLISNPKVEPGYAKFLGLISATGDYLLYLDSDEALDNPKSIDVKIKFLRSHLNSIICLSQGYSITTKVNFISKYISDFGDPFSAFMYRTSKLNTFFNKDMKRTCEIDHSNDEIDIFNLKKIKYMPMIEITTMGSLVDLKVLKKEFAELFEESHLIPHAFYMIVKKFPMVGMVKYDSVSHFSSNQFSSYLGKIKSRVRNNIHFSSDLGLVGYCGRSQFDTKLFKAKKYLFVPYVLLLIPLLIDTANLMKSRKDSRYSLHFVLSIYTFSLICIEFSKKILGIKQLRKSYGESNIINS